MVSDLLICHPWWKPHIIAPRSTELICKPHNRSCSNCHWNDLIVSMCCSTLGTDINQPCSGKRTYPRQRYLHSCWASLDFLDWEDYIYMYISYHTIIWSAFSFRLMFPDDILYCAFLERILNFAHRCMIIIQITSHINAQLYLVQLGGGGGAQRTVALGTMIEISYHGNRRLSIRLGSTNFVNTSSLGLGGTRL